MRVAPQEHREGVEKKRADAFHFRDELEAKKSSGAAGGAAAASSGAAGGAAGGAAAASSATEGSAKDPAAAKQLPKRLNLGSAQPFKPTPGSSLWYEPTTDRVRISWAKGARK